MRRVFAPGALRAKYTNLDQKKVRRPECLNLDKAVYILIRTYVHLLH